MKKSDLKNRMVVRLRSGEFRMIIDNILIAHDSIFFAMDLSQYNDDMTLIRPYIDVMFCGGGSVCDIMEVYDVCYCLNIKGFVSLHRPIWKREEELIEVTMAEVEEKFGCPVKIVKEKEETLRPYAIY